MPYLDSISRRRFVKTVAGASGALALSTPALLAEKENKKPKKDSLADVQHFVVVMMENRSFDHFLGWMPGAVGKQAGLTYLDAQGQPFSTHPLAPDYQGLGYSDPDHSHEGGLVEYNGGRCDGWLRAGSNDAYAIGYYTQNDLPFLGQAAPAWTTCDRYFAGTLAETYPNRIYQHAAQTDRLTNTTNLSTLPTIWDRLADAGISRRYYFSDVPILALWGGRYAGISQLSSRFFADCAAGTLPAVSFVDPHFLGEAEGLSDDDHPHADVRNGEVFLNKVYQAVVSSPNWANTVMVINFDEWGGFFEHVAPTTAPLPSADRAAGDAIGLRGFRVPALVISPWARRASVAHGTYDHTSVLRMIENRWKLRPLTVRDASANDLSEVLDFSSRNLAAPLFNVPAGPFGISTPIPAIPATTRAATPATGDKWSQLGAVARMVGFPTPTS